MAVNNRDKNFTDRKLAARIEQLEESIKRYPVELDRADRNAAAVLPGRVAHLKDKITKVKQQIRALNKIGEQMKSSKDGQISLTDPDARSMATSGRDTGVVGYNVQTVVDAKHPLIVAHEVTNVGHDRNQLAHMAKLAKAATAEDALIALSQVLVVRLPPMPHEAAMHYGQGTAHLAVGTRSHTGYHSRAARRCT